MRGYYIIQGDGELIEITGKNARVRAITKAKELIIEQCDTNLIVQQFDDSNKNGCMDGLEYLSSTEIMWIS